jgi:hypothetical protein
LSERVSANPTPVFPMPRLSQRIQDQRLAFRQWYEYCMRGAKSRWLYGTCDKQIRASGGYSMSDRVVFNRAVELAMLLAFLASLAAVVAFEV